MTRIRFANSSLLCSALWCVSLGVPAAAARQKKPATAPPTKSAHAASTARKAPEPAVRSLEISPAHVLLSGPRSEQLLAVVAHYADGSVRDVSTQVRYQTVPASIAAVSPDGLVTPAADGKAEVRVTLGKVSGHVAVSVADSHSAAPIRFSREVVPVLTRAGCNALSCHGSPTGKQGFKLSMFGYSPAEDYDALVKQERTVPEKGKRADLTQPEQSLFLKKATLQVPHQGGQRFRPNSPEYRLLLGWLKEGAPIDSDPGAEVTRVEIAPSEWAAQRPGEHRRILVTAQYADGRTEDVTRRSIFQSNDDSVVEAGDEGLTSSGVGETAILARYLGRVATAQAYVPQPDAVKEHDYASFRPANLVDQATLAKWRKMRYVPSEPCTDAEFLRRVSLDLTGTLPAPEEVRAFLASTSARKREEKIDELLGRPEYVDWWTLFWGDILRNNSRTLQPAGAQAFFDWIRKSVADNKPYDRFARELVTASGETYTNGAANFYRVAMTPTERAEQVAQVFLGIRLQCAQCHNHPFEKWTRDSYHQFAAIFSAVQARGQGKNGFTVSLSPKGSYKHPETGKVMTPALLDANTAFPDDKDRREVLADWLVAPENPLFAREIVNRLWGRMFGRGIIDPVDDVRVTNPPVNEALLDGLAKELVSHQYDLKHVLRLIANSRTYQLSVRPNPHNERDRQNFSRAYYRRLPAEALLDAVCKATEVPEAYNGYPAGTRAIQLVDGRVNSYFMDIFGRPRREVVCTCEREETANITQALDLINGPINQKISSPKGCIPRLLQSGKSDDEILDELYLASLGRPATDDEKAAGRKQLGSRAADRRRGLEDLLWVLLNSREFLFNH